MLTAICPACKQKLIFNTIPEIGFRLVCDNCKEHLEVTWLFPLAIDYEELNEETFGEQPSDAEDQFY